MVEAAGTAVAVDTVKDMVMVEAAEVVDTGMVDTGTAEKGTVTDAD